MKINEIILNERVSRDELRALKLYLQKQYEPIGLDVEFSSHFVDRVNDPRNEPEISTAELGKLFRKSLDRYGKTFKDMHPETEVVLKDISTALNVPIAIKRSEDAEKAVLATTVMRKKNYQTRDKVFKV